MRSPRSPNEEGKKNNKDIRRQTIAHSSSDRSQQTGKKKRPMNINPLEHCRVPHFLLLLLLLLFVRLETRISDKRPNAASGLMRQAGKKKKDEQQDYRGADWENTLSPQPAHLYATRVVHLRRKQRERKSSSSCWMDG